MKRLALLLAFGMLCCSSVSAAARFRVDITVNNETNEELRLNINDRGNIGNMTVKAGETASKGFEVLYNYGFVYYICNHRSDEASVHYSDQEPNIEITIAANCKNRVSYRS